VGMAKSDMAMPHLYHLARPLAWSNFWPLRMT
jgi:hypothetical protein